MVMTQMLMRWKPLASLRNRRRHKTRAVEREQREKARAAQSVHRFVGLAEADARALAKELDLPIRFYRPGEGVMDDYCAGRVTAQLKDDVVVAPHSE